MLRAIAVDGRKIRGSGDGHAAVRHVLARRRLRQRCGGLAWQIISVPFGPNALPRRTELLLIFLFGESRILLLGAPVAGGRV
jgi:hypothetical protein